MGVGYRVGQFWRLLRASALPATAWAEIGEILHEEELALFRQYGVGDQWHSYTVFCMLRDAGHDDPDLLAAALLHDVGKARAPLTVWERSLIVLVQLLWPGWLAAWGAGAPRGWKRPFVVKVQHPAWGAEMAAAAGSRPLTVTLIRRHQDEVLQTENTRAAQLLRLLQWADDQN